MDRAGGEPPGIAGTLRTVLSRAEAGGLTVAGLRDAFAERAFGLLLLLLNLPNVIFAPPVLAGIAAVPTLVFGLQMMAGHSRPWLPKGLLDKPVAVPALRRVVERAAPWLDRLEGLGRPRLPWAAGPAAIRVFGLFAVLASVIVLIPIPGTNVLPALSLVILAVALIRRDGLLVLLGAGIGVAGLLVAIAAAGIAVELVRWAYAWVAG